MARNTTRRYRRLPGGRLTRHSLWRAPDYLLKVERRAFSERYARLFFRDIQAILTQKTATHVILNVIFASLTGLFGLLAITRESSAALIVWGIIAGIFAMLLAWNWHLGPTCACYIVTAINRYRISSLSRIRIAERVIGMLTPLIEEAQQHIEIQESSTSSTDFKESPELYFRQPSQVRPIPQPIPHYHGALHIAAFAVLLVNGLLLGSALLLYRFWTVGLYTSTTVGLSACVIMALVKQHRSDMPTAIKGITWGALGYTAVSYITGYAFFMTAFIKYVTRAGRAFVNDDLAAFRTFTQFSLTDFPVFMGIYLALLGSAVLLGGLGLLLTLRFRQEYAA